MKTTLIIFQIIFSNISFSQKIEKINIPKGVTYNYCDTEILNQAINRINENLTDSLDYSLSQKILIIGPQLWKRYKNINLLSTIEGGNTQFHVDELILDGKMSQDIKDSKKIWNEFRKEINGNYTIRKANEKELTYYWSVISFDIDEPLLIVETKEHNYILNILQDDLKLMWLDEVPENKKYHNPIENKTYESKNGFKTYNNGQEVTTNSEGIKESKLEKIVLLSSDEELKDNSSVEDLKEFITKTNEIFNELFKDSEKSGKIMIQFEIKKKKNIIQFAVQGNLDLEIMKEFEKQVNKEKYPNSKKKPIKIQLIYKVNSLNDIK